MRNDERRRERTCTSKRAFKTAEYAGMFLENELKRTGEMDVYRCGFCGDYHLGHNRFRISDLGLRKSSL